MTTRLARPRSVLLALLLALVLVIPAGFATADTIRTAGTSSPTDTPAPTDTVPLPTDTVPVPTDTVPVPTDTVPVPTDTVPVPTDTVPVPTDTVPVPTDTVPVPTDTVPVPTDTVPVPTDTVPVPTDTVPVPTDTVPVPTDTVPVPTDTVPVPTDQPTPTDSVPVGGPPVTSHPHKPHPHKGTGGFHVPPLPGGAPKRPHPHKPITTVHHLTLPARPHPHVTPWPITLTIKTVPSLANVAFNFDGHWVTTDQYGVATVTEEHNLAPHTLRIGDLGQEDTGLKFRFTRWVGQRDPTQQLKTTVTGLPMRADATIYAAISVQYPVTLRVLTQRGAPVLDSDVSSITVRSSTGQLSVLMPGQQAWLDGVEPSFQKNALNPELVNYSVQSIVVHGSNTADAGKQRFDVTKTSTPTLTALFFDLTVTGRDSLFGWPLGSRATVRYPDGSTLTVNLGRQHRAVLADLPRGRYEVTLAASRSIVSTAKVQLSRTIAYQVRAVTLLDLLTVLVSAMLVAVLLLVLGRTDWAHRLLSRARPGRWAAAGRWLARGRWARSGRRARPDQEPSTPLAKLLR